MGGVVQVTKAGSERWKQMTPETKQPFEDQAAAAREIYTKAKADYEAKGGAARFKLQKGPPRPPTAYFMFLSAFRQEYKLRNPEVKGIKDMAREAGEKCRGMDQDAKRPFEEKAKRAKDEYNKLKAMTPRSAFKQRSTSPTGKSTSSSCERDPPRGGILARARLQRVHKQRALSDHDFV